MQQSRYSLFRCSEIEHPGVQTLTLNLGMKLHLTCSQRWSRMEHLILHPQASLLGLRKTKTEKSGSMATVEMDCD